MEKFVSPFSPPEGLERELLECLAEECSEVIKRCMKAQRFGIDEIQSGQELTNHQRIALEAGDVMEVIGRLVEEGILDYSYIQMGMTNKKKQLETFLQNEGGS